MTALSDKYAEALSYAHELHLLQRRKGTDIPYIAHLLAVSSLVLEHGGTEHEAIGALLHDAVEDQGGAPILAVIKQRFGDEVAAIVDGCTDTDVTPKPPWRARKEHYVAHVAAASRSVRLVSAADKLHNARSILADHHVIGDAIWQRFSGGKTGSLWYYRALINAYRSASDAPTALVDELDRVVSELERHA